MKRLALTLILAACLAGGSSPALGQGGEPNPQSAAAIQAPVLKWENGGCYSSWCETGWYSSPAVADLDGDGQAEVIGAGYTIFVLDGASGAQKWHMPSGYDRSQPGASSVGRTWPGIAVADLQGDGSLEIVTAHSGGVVSVYDAQGYFMPGWPQHPTSSELRGLSLADLDGDGKLEIVVTAAIGSKTNTWVYEPDGSLRPGWPQLSNNSGYAAGVYNDNSALGDINGDGQAEAAVPSDVYYINAYTPNGGQLPANPMYGGRTWGQVGAWQSPDTELRGWGTCTAGDLPAERYRANFADGPAAIGDVNGDGLPDRISPGRATLNIDATIAVAAAGREIRNWMLDAPLPHGLETALRHNHRLMCAEAGEDLQFAVRSSATAEDLPDASFAGQQETFLNIQGADNLIDAVKLCFASLYNDRAITYRVHHGFAHDSVALSAGIQRMVRSDLGVAGVMFTLDTESGFPDVVFINAAYGLGETVVQGSVNPDEYYVHKPNLAAGKRAVIRKKLGDKATRMVFAHEAVAERSTKVEDVPPGLRHNFALDDDELLELSRYAVIIEQHYGRPMDIEWGRDGIDGKLYILQARPETVKSRAGQVEIRYKLLEKGPVIAHGRAIGSKIGQGRARIVKSLDQMHLVQPGDVLVAEMTDPDWEPVMKRAAAIITDRGGRTCHAAIVARELGVPAVVGVGDATTTVPDGSEVTVSCAEGEDGHVYQGLLKFEKSETVMKTMPDLPVKIMMNVGNPEQAFHFAMLPNDGVGLARLEFIISNAIGIHPNAALDFSKMPEPVKQAIAAKIVGYRDPVSFYVEKLAEGVATIAAAFWPKRVIVRMSDFKSNEYANLIGGPQYEPQEENPMLGFRGAGRYAHPLFRRAFQLECRAIRRVREDMGLTNVEIMLPFVRTLKDADDALGVLADNDLKRGVDGLKVVMMCELPSNVLLAEEFLQRFDGFSIGSNDLTQLTLGLDRDSSLVAEKFDERNPAVKKLLSMAIAACRKEGKYVGICGQGPSDHPDLAEWLVGEGIDSLSLNPDTVVSTWTRLAAGGTPGVEHLDQPPGRGCDCERRWRGEAGDGRTLHVIGAGVRRALGATGPHPRQEPVEHLRCRLCLEAYAHRCCRQRHLRGEADTGLLQHEDVECVVCEKVAPVLDKAG